MEKQRMDKNVLVFDKPGDRYKSSAIMVFARKIESPIEVDDIRDNLPGCEEINEGDYLVYFPNRNTYLPAKEEYILSKFNKVDYDVDFDLIEGFMRESCLLPANKCVAPSVKGIFKCPKFTICHARLRERLR